MSASTLLHEARGATYELPTLDMKGGPHDGEKHMSFPNVQQFFHSNPLSAMGSLPLFGETGTGQVLGMPAIGCFSVPDSSKAGSSLPHKDPNAQVGALFGTNKSELETLDPENRQGIKDLLKRPVFGGDWATFKPPKGHYRRLWCKRMAPDLLVYIFCSFFSDEEILYARRA